MGKDSNYAAMIYAILDNNGKVKKWEHEIVTRMDAYLRLSTNKNLKGEKVLIPEESPTKKFLFALRKNDSILLDHPDGGEQVLYKVQSFSKSEIQLCENLYSLVNNESRTKFNRITSIDQFRKRNLEIVLVNILGQIQVKKMPTS